MGEGLRHGAAVYGCQELGEDSDPSERFRDRALPASQAAPGGEQEDGVISELPGVDEGVAEPVPP
eukprot:9588110-Alexandrium_andersonii.AAC.1